MQERARELGGKLHLESSAAGTLVRISAPIPTDCVAAPLVSRSNS